MQMRTAGWLTMGILASVGAAVALPAADQALLDRYRVETARPLLVETALVDGGTGRAAIVPGETAAQQAAAEQLQAAIAAATGVTLPIVPARDLDPQDWSSQHLLVLGNLQTSAAFARLYHNFFVCADAGYTGTAGYELRSVHEPFRTGQNAIAVGAQAPAGLAAGVERLIALIGEHGGQGRLVLPRLMELNLQRAGRREAVAAPLSESLIESNKLALEQIYDRPGTERGGPSRTIRDAMSYHRSGDPGYLELYRHGIARHMRYYAENEYIQEAGLRRYDRDFRDSWTWKLVVTWDLLEEAPGWTDAERLAITNHLLQCVIECNVYQRWDSPEAIERWRNFSGVTHNHHTWPGLANLFGGWYFGRHYDHPLANDWLAIAHGMFNACKHSGKPWEDSAAYQWIPQRHVLTYCLATGDPTHVDGGHAAWTGKEALMVTDNLGHQSAFGDHSAFTGASYLPEILSVLEYATNDGRYRWAMEELLNATYGGELDEPYWTDLKPVRPDDLAGVAVVHLPRPHFDLNGSQPQYFPRSEIPYEESFSKLTLRAGWERTDDYLLIDGWSGGSHGHEDANAIINYTAGGYHWLTDGEYIRSTPKYHCMLTVVRDGQATRSPAAVRLDQAAWFGDLGLTQTTATEYNGVDWTRQLYWQPNGVVVAIDSVTAREAGHYGLRLCWRVYGQPDLAGDSLSLVQGEAGFQLRNLSADSQELVHIKEVARFPVSQLYQRRSVDLAAGQTVHFLNVFQGTAGGVPSLAASRAGEGVVRVETPNGALLCGRGGWQAGEWASDAAVWAASPQAVWLAGATTLRRGGQEVLAGQEAMRLTATGIQAAVAEEPPAPGLRTVRRLTEAAAPGAAPGLSDVLLGAFASPQPAMPPRAAAAVQQAPRQEAAWSFGEFARATLPLPVLSVKAAPEPTRNFLPVERLIDGAYSSSAYSCMFPAGESVAIELDLGEVKQVSEIRIRAWEMNEAWHSANRRAAVATVPGQWRAVDAEFAVVGEQRWSSNVNTIYGVPVDEPVRYLRVTADPATPQSQVYFAEVEVHGLDLGRLPELTALVAADLTGDGRLATVAGTAGGDLVALDAAGQPLWQLRLEHPVTALAAGDLNGDGRDEIIYGAGADTLGVVSSVGQLGETVRIPAYRGIASRVMNVHVADLAGDGQQSIVAGVASWMYVAYSPELKLRWKTVIYAHSATAGQVVDLDGDGRQEVVAGNAYYRLNLINHDGRMRLQAGRFGPEQTAVAAGNLAGDAALEVAVGTDGGDVLVFDLAGQLLWQQNVGDRVSRLHVVHDDAGPGHLVAASESGWVWCFDGSGRRLWGSDLGFPVRDLERWGDGWVAAASEAGLVWLSADGQVARVAGTGRGATMVSLTDGLAVAATADGEVVGVALR